MGEWEKDKTASLREIIQEDSKGRIHKWLMRQLAGENASERHLSFYIYAN
jgi:hypothetical protein